MRISRLVFISIAAAGLARPVHAAPAARLTTLYNFKGNPSDGLNPVGRLLYQGGFLYGTTAAGGTSGNGIIFKIDPKQKAETVLYSFALAVGSDVQAGLISLNGNFYGTAEGGGAAGLGSIYSFNPATGQASMLSAIDDPQEGAFPDGELLAIGNELYGVSQAGGVPLRFGAVYEINSATGASSLLYVFQGGADGATPFGALIQQKNYLLGTTQAGGAANAGTVFKVDIGSGKETQLYSFKGGTDGASPDAGLAAKGDRFYGTTYGGGAAGLGTIYQLDAASGVKTTLYSFKGGADGANPVAGLLVSNGALYGTTYGGGAGYGTVFSVNIKTGAESLLYSFTGGTDGANPVGQLILAQGKLYGTTKSGGSSGAGTVFKLAL